MRNLLYRASRQITAMETKEMERENLLLAEIVSAVLVFMFVSRIM
jgi:hypothetical protein